jgi:curved DNA-binding protein CbpA
MITTVTSPNHYERLGLSPDAGEEEIARAFAVAMSPLMPRTVRDLAEIAIAFETLRDPAKRRAYDAAIAPPPEPEPEPAPAAMFPREGWPFIASARIRSAELPAIDTLPRRAPNAEPGPPPPRFEEPLRQLVPERFERAEHAAAEWKRPLVAIGGLFLGVAVIGAGLGWYASRGIAPAQAEQAVMFPLPRAEKPPIERPPTPAPATAKHRSGTIEAPARSRRAPEAAQAVERVQQRAQDVPDIPSEQVAALASGAMEAPAAMPLPDSVVARTIGRIGYACGEVASTTAVDGASGVFKVTCTSGDSYRASPVRGRYHFKRWTGD